MEKIFGYHILYKKTQLDCIFQEKIEKEKNECYYRDDSFHSKWKKVQLYLFVLSRIFRLKFSVLSFDNVTFDRVTK